MGSFMVYDSLTPAHSDFVEAYLTFRICFLPGYVSRPDRWGVAESDIRILLVYGPHRIGGFYLIWPLGHLG